LSRFFRNDDLFQIDLPNQRLLLQKADLLIVLLLKRIDERNIRQRRLADAVRDAWGWNDC
jgi:hypothetical protein